MSTIPPLFKPILYLTFMILLSSSLYSQNTEQTNDDILLDSLIASCLTASENGDLDEDSAMTMTIHAENLTIDRYGKQSTQYALICLAMGRIYGRMTDFPNAEKRLLEAKKIQEIRLDKTSFDYEQTIEKLAYLYHDLNQYEVAEQYYNEALSMLEIIKGKDSPEYNYCLAIKGVLFLHIGELDKAESTLMEVRDRLKRLGKTFDLDYATCLGYLGYLYNEMSILDKAEVFLLEAKSIFIDTLGTDMPEYASCLTNLAVTYQQRGNLSEALANVLESSKIMEKFYGAESRNYALGLSDLAYLYWAMGLLKEAESSCLKAMDINEKAFGKDHHSYANNLGILSMIYEDQHLFENALKVDLESKSIREKILGKDHPDYTLSLNNLASLYLKMGNYSQAQIYLEELSQSIQNNITRAVKHLSESELTTYVQSFSGKNAGALALAQSTYGKNLNIAKTCYNNALFLKGYLQNAVSQMRNLALSDSISAELFLELQSQEAALAAEYSLPIADQQNVPKLKAGIDDLEKQVARIVSGFGEARQQVTWQDVQRNLKSDEAAIEIVHFPIDKMHTDSILYAALVIIPGDTEPEYIPLFEEKQLSNLLQTNSEVPTEDMLTQMYSRGLTPQSTGTMDGLYNLIWRPLVSKLQNTNTIYYSPSGLLHRINFDAIPVDGMENLSDQYFLVRMGSTRALAFPHTQLNQSNQTAVLYGGIDYEMDTTSTLSSDEQYTFVKSTNDLNFSDYKRSADLRGTEWNYLPATKTEVQNIRTLLNTIHFKTTTLTGKQATEESIKQFQSSTISPMVLHIATHGYFFPDPQKNQAGEIIDPGRIFQQSDQPMIRSGLVMAGGNYTWKGGTPLPGRDDGILTAFEISKLDLRHTEIVILSACETGLGDIQGNEGVYGLQRAFKIAGAHYLMMSLWQVPDKETMEFMTLFYRSWLDGKKSIPEAFHAAQLDMRKRYSNPYVWAGFILVE